MYTSYRFRQFILRHWRCLLHKNVPKVIYLIYRLAEHSYTSSALPETSHHPVHQQISITSTALRKKMQTSWRLTNKRPTWCHLLFYFTYYALNMFRTLIYPSSGACDCCWITTSVVLFSVRCVLELLVRLVFGGVRFAGCSLQNENMWCVKRRGVF